ncbi:MAG: divalent metal cation transporter FieF [Rhodospirillales bacterium RIFCSPLOWO2_12_FULL_67_15]|nr:MAG: divalent metal cation transporter FieF [Rhodospirillales bacterium RIFCSPLOWO2_12_FULL_67_15]
MRLAAHASVAVASLLILIKLAAWLITDSVSLLSTLIDSLLDVGASLVNLIAIRHALTPADKEHRFGHGKAEALAGLGQAAFVAGSAAFLLVQAGERLLRPRPLANPDIGIAVMVFSIAVTLALVVFQKYVARRTASVAIGADSLHYETDVLANAGVIVSLILVSRFGWPAADPLVAIAIVGYIFWGAWAIGARALHILMDRELPDADRDKIRAIAKSHPAVRGVHDLKTRSSGSHLFIQLHLELDGNMKLTDVHVVSENVMERITTAYPNAEVIVHEDPEGVVERRAVYG